MGQQTDNISEAPYITFLIEKEQYGLSILKVLEIRGYVNIHPIANVKDYVKGIINLWDEIIPIIDLRILFGNPSPSYGGLTTIIIVNGENSKIGLVVDKVIEVIILKDNEMKILPNYEGPIELSFIETVATGANNSFLIIDTGKLKRHINLEQLKINDNAK